MIPDEMYFKEHLDLTSITYDKLIEFCNSIIQQTYSQGTTNVNVWQQVDEHNDPWFHVFEFYRPPSNKAIQKKIDSLQAEIDKLEKLKK